MAPCLPADAPQEATPPPLRSPPVPWGRSGPAPLPVRRGRRGTAEAAPRPPPPTAAAAAVPLPPASRAAGSGGGDARGRREHRAHRGGARSLGVPLRGLEEGGGAFQLPPHLRWGRGLFIRDRPPQLWEGAGLGWAPLGGRWERGLFPDGSLEAGGAQGIAPIRALPRRDTVGAPVCVWISPGW